MYSVHVRFVQAQRVMPTNLECYTTPKNSTSIWIRLDSLGEYGQAGEVGSVVNPLEPIKQGSAERSHAQHIQGDIETAVVS